MDNLTSIIKNLNSFFKLLQNVKELSATATRFRSTVWLLTRRPEQTAKLKAQYH